MALLLAFDARKFATLLYLYQYATDPQVKPCRNIAVVAGGSIPKLYMNSRDHMKKGLKALEDCVGSFAVLLVPDDGTNPIMRLDVLGKHTVGAGGAPQAVTSALIFEPLQAAGLTLTFNLPDKQFQF